MNEDFEYIKKIYNKRFSNKSLSNISKQGWGTKESNFKISNFVKYWILKKQEYFGYWLWDGRFFCFLKKKKFLTTQVLIFQNYL